MCGRYTLKSTTEEISELIPGKFQYPLFSPSYNIAPSQKSLIATVHDDIYQGELARWGLVPHWMKNPKKPFINARSETIFEKPSFKYLYGKNRCIVIADGFYEWAIFEGVKRPVYFYLKDHKPFGFAGYWENDRTEENTKSFVVMTTDANEDIDKFHHRMPVMLTKDGIRAWLEDGDKSVLTAISEPVFSHIVSRAVNSPANNTPECIEPKELELDLLSGQ
jgi:putative SOS response-associated peptidase YedK